MKKKYLIPLFLGIGLLFVGFILLPAFFSPNKETKKEEKGTIYRLVKVTVDGEQTYHNQEECTDDYLKVTEKKIDFYDIFESGATRKNTRFYFLDGITLYLSLKPDGTKDTDFIDKELGIKSMSLEIKGDQLILRENIVDSQNVYLYQKTTPEELKKCFKGD